MDEQVDEIRVRPPPIRDRIASEKQSSDPRRKRGAKRKLAERRELISLISTAREGGVGVDEKSVEDLTRSCRYLESTIRRLYPHQQMDPSAIDRLMWEAYRSTDGIYGEAEALAWANGFRIPGSVKIRDDEGLQRTGSLEGYVSEVHQKMSEGGRLSHASIIAAGVPEDDPDYSRLKDLVDGITILTDEDFVPNQAPQPLRAKYVRMQSVVDKLMMELYEDGMILILPTATVQQIPGVHFSQSHWALKKGKVWGRPIGDASAPSEDTGVALNSAAVKEMCIQKWGNIHHPTVTSLSALVLRQAARVGWDNLVLWKMDLKGAFTLLFIRPDCVRKAAFALGADKDGVDLSMMYPVGFFGWTGLPFAFAIVSNVVTRLVNRVTYGESEMYVDDLMGGCAETELAHDLAAAREKCVQLLGNGSVADDKTEHGRIIDFIGWEFDLETRVVSVARRNFMKTLYGMICMRGSETNPTVREVQRVASWASRYSVVCRSLKPFSVDLYDAVRGYREQRARIRLGKVQLRALDMWISTLAMLEFGKADFARPIHTIPWRRPQFLIEYDASLYGLGIILSELDVEGAECGVESKPRFMRAIKMPIPYDLGSDPSFQNSTEFLAVVMGMACLVSLGCKGAGVRVKGDNRSSLSSVPGARRRGLDQRSAGRVPSISWLLQLGGI